jgi:hypothetical protein
MDREPIGELHLVFDGADDTNMAYFSTAAGYAGS